MWNNEEVLHGAGKYAILVFDEGWRPPHLLFCESFGDVVVDMQACEAFVHLPFYDIHDCQ